MDAHLTGTHELGQAEWRAAIQMTPYPALCDTQSHSELRPFPLLAAKTQMHYL